MKRQRLLYLAMAVVVLLAWAMPAPAQTNQTGAIEGRVTDADGSPVDGAMILCAQADGSYPHNAISDKTGRYRIQFLVPGSYNIAVQAENLNPLSVTGVRVSAGESRQLPLQMKKALEVKEEVTVTASTPLVDRVTTDHGSTIEKRTIEALPLGRSATSALNLVPGVSQDAAWGAASVQANNYMFDGVSVNQPGFGGDFLLPNPDWIEELQVKGLGAGAEFGNFQGAAVNIVTKSGSNTFRGAVRANFESSSWDSKQELRPTDYGLVLDRRFEVNTDISGPIVKDKLYYFLSLEEAKTDEKATDVYHGALTGNVSYLDTMEKRKEDKIFGKLTWQASNNDSLNLVLGVDNVTTDNRGIDAFTDPVATVEQKSPATFWNLGYQRIFDASNFIEAKITGYTGKDDRLPYGGSGLPGIQIIGGNANLYQNNPYTRYKKPQSNAISLKWDSYWQTGSVAHHLMVGGEAEQGKWREQRFRNGNLTWRPDNIALTSGQSADPNNWGYISSDWGGEIDLNAATVNNALYVQDYAQITPNLTINAGVRWGQWEGKLTPGFNAGPQFTAMKDTGFDPRIGLSWDIAGNGKWVAKAHWGIYHQGMFALLFDRAAGGNVFTSTEYWDWVGEGNPDPRHAYTVAERGNLFEFYDDSGVGSENGPVVNYKQPYVDEWVASLEKVFATDWKVGLTYVHRTNKNMTALVDRNAATNYDRFTNVEAYNFNTDTTDAILPEVYVRSASYNPDFILTTEPRADRKMEQWQLELSRAGRGWRMNASLVYTDLTGNFDSVSGYSDTLDGTGAGGFANPNESVNWSGRLPYQDKWQFKLNGNVELPGHVRAAGFFSWNSGAYYTPYFTIDTNNYDFYDSNGNLINYRKFRGVTRQNVFTEARGSEKYPSYSRLDLRIDRPFTLGRGIDLVVALDIFNVFDSQKTLSVVEKQNAPGALEIIAPGGETVTQALPGFGEVRSQQSPRAFRVSTALRW